MSDQDNSIFNTNPEGVPPVQTPVAQPNTSDTLDQLLAGIQNEQGVPKYKTAEDAIRALQASQEHIQRLESENSQYKNNVTEQATLQSVLDAVKPQSGGEPVVPPTIDEASVASLVESIVSKRDMQATQTTNVKTVAGKFNELFGDKGESEMYSRAEAKGLSREWVNKLAAENPNAVFNILDVKAGASTPNLTPSHNNGFQEPTKIQPKKFDPFTPRENSDVSSWRKSAQATNERLGISES